MVNDNDDSLPPMTKSLLGCLRTGVEDEKSAYRAYLFRKYGTDDDDVVVETVERRMRERAEASVLRDGAYQPCDDPDRQLLDVDCNGAWYRTAIEVPLSVLEEVAAIFQLAGWDLAFWVFSVNSYLGGQVPVAVMRSAPDDVVRAARAEADWQPNG
jgi:hypothetical protein